MKSLVEAFLDEARALPRDRAAVGALVGGVLLYAVVYPVPYSQNLVRDVPVAVVDQDRSALSRRLTTLVDAADLTRVAGVTGSLAEAEEMLREERVSGILVIPMSFQKAVLSGQQAVLGVYGDGSAFLVNRQVAGGLRTVAGTISAAIEIQRLVAEGLAYEQAVVGRDPLPVLTRPLFDPTEGYFAYVVPPVFILVLYQTLQVGLGTRGVALRESARSRRPRPGWVPLRVLGRALAPTCLYLVWSVAYFWVLPRAYGLPQNARLHELLAFVFPFILASTFFAYAVSSRFERRETPGQVLLFSTVPILFLSGFSFPIESMPSWVAGLALIFPSTPAIRGLLRLNCMGASFAQVATEWLILWLQAGAYFALTCVLVRRRTARAS